MDPLSILSSAAGITGLCIKVSIPIAIMVNQY
jgi:hypothetical protein